MVNFDYLYNPEAARKAFEKNYFIDKDLGFKVIEKGIILPHKKIPTTDIKRKIWGFGGIVDCNGNYIKNSFVTTRDGKSYTSPLN